MGDPSPSTSVGTNAQEAIELRRGKRRRIEKDLGLGMFTYSIEEDPITYEETMSLPDANLWKKALDDEIKSIHDNNTWTLIDLPSNTKTISCK